MEGFTGVEEERKNVNQMGRKKAKGKRRGKTRKTEGRDETNKMNASRGKYKYWEIKERISRNVERIACVIEIIKKLIDCKNVAKLLQKKYV